MKVWVMFFYEIDSQWEILGSDGVCPLDARFSLENLKAQCNERAKTPTRRAKAFQIHRSSRWSVENPITPRIEVR